METLEREPMAKMGRPAKGRDDITIRVEREIGKQLGVVAKIKDISTVELASDLLREPLGKLYRELVRTAPEKKGSK